MSLPFVALIAFVAWVFIDQKPSTTTSPVAEIASPSVEDLLFVQDPGAWTEMAMTGPDDLFPMELGTDISQNDIALYFERTETDITELLINP